MIESCLKCCPFYVLYLFLCVYLARLPQDDTESFQEQRKDGLESRQKIFRFDERDFFLFLPRYSSVCLTHKYRLGTVSVSYHLRPENIFTQKKFTHTI